MNRREILKYTTLLTGAAVAAPLAGSLFWSCKPTIAEDAVQDGLYFFSEDEFSFLQELIDIILPQTESPSATEVGVHQIIDSMVGRVYPTEYRNIYRNGFTSLKNLLEKAPDMKQTLHQIENGQDSEEEIKAAFLHVKQQTIAYYLSTEEIGKHYLNYLPLPGEYLSCISLEEAGGKAWTL